MKTIIQFITIIFTMLLIVNVIKAQVKYNTKIILTSQSQIDEFSVKYPSFTEFDTILILGEKINSLVPLKQLNKASFIRIYRTNIENLNGFENLTHLKSILIDENLLLVSVASLEMLKHCRHILLRLLPSITNLTGIVGDSINTIALVNLPKLIDIKDLRCLNCTGLYLNDLEGITNIENSFFPSLDLLLLNNVNTIEGIENFSFRILQLISMKNLVDISNLDKITKLSSILIEGCRDLENCSTEKICSMINKNQNVEAYWNGNGCNGKNEIKAKCVSSASSPTAKPATLLFPNPATDYITLSKLTFTSKISIYSTDGRQIGSPVILDDQIDLSQLTAGLYFLRVSDGANVSNYKFMKQ